MHGLWCCFIFELVSNTFLNSEIGVMIIEDLKDYCLLSNVKTFDGYKQNMHGPIFPKGFTRGLLNGRPRTFKNIGFETEFSKPRLKDVVLDMCLTLRS